MTGSDLYFERTDGEAEEIEKQWTWEKGMSFGCILEMNGWHCSVWGVVREGERNQR